MPRTSSQPRRNGSLTQADQVLDLQRSIGNRATALAIQRAGTAAPEEIPLEDLTQPPAATAGATPAPAPASAPQRESLPKATAEDSLFTSKEVTGRLGPFTSPQGSWFGAAGSTVSYKAKKLNGASAAALGRQGQDASLAGAAIGMVGDSLTLANKGAELHDARKDARAAKDSGSAFWEKAARRQKRVKGADVVVGTGKTASAIPKMVSSGMSLGGYTGAAAGIAAGGIALPVTTLSALRDLWKLGKQAARARRMKKALLDDSGANSVQAARQLLADVDEQLHADRQRLASAGQAVSDARKHMDLVWQYAADGDQQKLKEATSLLSEATDLLPRAEQSVRDYRAAVAETEALREQIQQAHAPITAAVTDLASEVAKMDKGEEPSLKAIAYYARVKNVKGSTRRAVKVLSGTLGVAAGVVALVALASGPAALAIGPAAIVLGAAGATLGLGLAAETGWRFLSKRWARTKGSWVETGKTGDDGKPGYKEVTGWLDRTVMTLSFRTKLYDKAGEGKQAEYKERKSHRKLMAAALWDYATSDKYDASVRAEAWKVIEALTGRKEDEILTPGPDAPGGRFTNETVREGQKAAALKLFEDKLKSA